MPNFNSGAYFLTTLIPIRTKAIQDGDAGTSPVHALRKALDKCPTAQQTPACGDEQSPFTCSKRAHFARFVVVDDVAYPGRNSPGTLLTEISSYFPQRFRIDPVVAQPQDHLSNPFLLFSVDFDATSGADSERDDLLIDLWREAETALRPIFTFCEKFDERVTDAESFAKYIAQCQIETTLPYHEYYLDGVPYDSLPTLSIPITGGIFLGAAVIAFLLLHWILPDFMLFDLVALAGGFAAAVFATVQYVTAQGRKPLPPCPGATLPEVLKSLYLQRALTRFAIDNQVEGADPQAAQQLYERFKHFIEENKPSDVQGPTQAPGVIGI